LRVFLSKNGRSAVAAPAAWERRKPRRIHTVWYLAPYFFLHLVGALR
jgi:hypothetical protein